jgi:hypothetical protein
MQTKPQSSEMKFALTARYLSALSWINSVKAKLIEKSKDERGDVPGWVLVVLMTTGLVTAIWTIASPRLSSILKDSLDSMNGIR